MLIVKEVYAKTILSNSKIFDYTINPYIGCTHGCTYCYARFIKRFTGHKEKWGEFVDVKLNAASLLQREIGKKRAGRVWMSGICDPYQPLENKYELTKGCLSILLKHGWPVTIQTKSSLVLRDVNLLREMDNVEVGLTITTADEHIRKIFEPNAPTINERIKTLTKLRSVGIQTFAMIAPMLPNTEGLVAQLNQKVDYVLVDRMNYHYADGVYKAHKLEYALTDSFFLQKKRDFTNELRKEGITFQMLF